MPAVLPERRVLFGGFSGLHKHVENSVENVQNLENQGFPRVTGFYGTGVNRNFFGGLYWKSMKKPETGRGATGYLQLRGIHAKIPYIE